MEGAGTDGAGTLTGALFATLGAGTACGCTGACRLPGGGIGIPPGGGIIIGPV
jgi:hypothetical protein